MANPERWNDIIGNGEIFQLFNMILHYFTLFRNISPYFKGEMAKRWNDIIIYFNLIIGHSRKVKWFNYFTQTYPPKKVKWLFHFIVIITGAFPKGEMGICFLYALYTWSRRWPALGAALNAPFGVSKLFPVPLWSGWHVISWIHVVNTRYIVDPRCKRTL